MRRMVLGVSKRGAGLLLAFMLTNCASYYQMNRDFNKNFEYGHLVRAQKILDKNEQQAEQKAQFLYFVNQGVVASLLGDYAKSNTWFEKAFLFHEDYRRRWDHVAASFLVNPKVLVYPGEDHEHLLLLYYKAYNYLKLNKYAEALVECRRLNNRLYALSDKYTSTGKYQRDAFSHTLMGLIYQANKDYNNAFIAYRNAVEIYEQDYQRMFNVETPRQLKEDLIRTAEYSGFYSEAEKFRMAFNMESFDPEVPGESLVFFWSNGLGPIKTEVSLTFVKNNVGQGRLVFSNPGIRQPFQFDVNSQDFSTLKGLSAVRIAVPKYLERLPIFQQGTLEYHQKSYELELVEDINAIAKKTLQERLLLELSKSLLRVALKKAVESQVSKENEGWGAIVSVLNAVTEQADTRNWQTLPHSIFYARIPLKVGTNEILLKAHSKSGQMKVESFTFEVAAGQTLFHNFHTLESR